MKIFCGIIVLCITAAVCGLPIETHPIQIIITPTTPSPSPVGVSLVALTSLYTLSLQSRDYFQSTLDAFAIYRPNNTEVPLEFCIIQSTTGESCNFEVLNQDLSNLEKVQEWLQIVIAYENAIDGTNGFVGQFLKSCNDKLNSLITSFQSLVSVPNSSGEALDATTNNSIPLYCTNCTSFTDQYKSLYEMHLVLEGVANDLLCLKNSNNNYGQINDSV